MEAPILRWSQRSFKNHSLVSENGWLGMHSGIRVVYRRLETIFPALFHPARTLSGSLRSPPSPRGEGFVSGIPLSPSNLRPLRGTSFHRKEGVSTRAPSLGRGTAPAVERVLSQAAHLRRSSSLFFIPLVPYPARSARHLPHAGKALFVAAMISCKDGAAYKSPGIPAPISPAHVRGLHRRF